MDEPQLTPDELKKANAVNWGCLGCLNALLIGAGLIAVGMVLSWLGLFGR